MRLYLDIDDFIPERSPCPVLTIGNFDGLHLGHRELVREVCALAEKHSGTPTALTFLPHPKAILTGTHPHRISTIRDKVTRLSAFGIESLIIQQFSWHLAAMEPENFVDWILDRIRPAAVVLGYDFRFGARGRGNVELVSSMATEQGIEVVQAKPFCVDGTTVSSSGIRDVLAAGNLAVAEKLLGYPYHLTGRVMHGAGRGKSLSIPTANLQPMQDLFLPTGIYAGAIIDIDGVPCTLPAAASLGYNPTFEKDRLTPSLEAHILDYDANLYEREVTLELWQRLRGEARYDTVQALVEQIHKDIEQTRSLFLHRKTA